MDIVMETWSLNQAVQRWDPEHSFARPCRLCFCLVRNPVHDPTQARTEAGSLSGGKNRATVEGRWRLTHLDLRAQLLKAAGSSGASVRYTFFQG